MTVIRNFFFTKYCYCAIYTVETISNDRKDKYINEYTNWHVNEHIKEYINE